VDTHVAMYGIEQPDIAAAHDRAADRERRIRQR
jgi:hypothetical protein